MTTPDPPRTLGERLRARRKELGLKPAAIARDVGIGVSTYYELENGRQKGSTKLFEVCERLGLSLKYVKSGRGPRLSSEAMHRVQETRPDYRTEAVVHGRPITAEEAEVGREWGKLDEPERSVAYKQILAMVKDQVLSKRRAKAEEKATGARAHGKPETRDRGDH